MLSPLQGLLLAVVAQPYCSTHLVAAPCKPGLVVQRGHTLRAPLRGFTPQGAGFHIDEVLDVGNLGACRLPSGATLITKRLGFSRLCMSGTSLGKPLAAVAAVVNSAVFSAPGLLLAAGSASLPLCGLASGLGLAVILTMGLLHLLVVSKCCNHPRLLL